MTVMVTLQRNERGVMNVLLLPLVVVGVLLVFCLFFAVYAFSGMQDYKTNSDQKSAAAVAAAIKKEDAKKALEFAEESKNPLKTYNGPAAFGSIQVQYPKTWSAYVVEQNNAASSVDGYFNPNFVPATTALSSSFALRVKVLGQTYASVMQSYQGMIKTQKLTATPYAFPKVPNVIGTKLTGEIIQGKQGSMVVVPLRASTLEVWNEGTTTTADFEKYILPNFLFSP